MSKDVPAGGGGFPINDIEQKIYPRGRIRGSRKKSSHNAAYDGEGPYALA